MSIAPDLKMYRSDTIVEIGTEGSPIDLGLCNAGETTLLPYDILLYNDKGAALDSGDAKNIQIELIRLYVSQQWDGTGLPSQTHTVSHISVASDVVEEVMVDDVKWRRVDSFSGLGMDDEVYKFNYTTGVLLFGNGVEGKEPPVGTDNIEITYIPDKNVYGKQIYADKWISLKSSGVIANTVHVGDVTPEESIKVDNDTVQVMRHPKFIDTNAIVGVWDNANKAGTNYFTSGSYDVDTGIIHLGSPMIADTPHTEYKYEINDDEESDYIVVGSGIKKDCENLIPQNNAKRIQLKVDIPFDAETEGGIFLKILLRIFYTR